MSRGGAFEYKFGQKNNWRRWSWNRICELLPKDKSNSVCVYLPGAKNLDAVVAAERGFQKQNLIGVERTPSVCKSLRAEGNLVVRGDFLIATSRLGESLPEISVVFGDFCGGPQSLLPMFVAGWMNTSIFRNCVFAFNFLRGHDPQWKQLGAQTFGLSRTVAAHTKHRGYQFLAAAFDGMSQVGSPSEVDRVRRMELVINHSLFTFGSYLSTSGQQFDSVVFRNPLYDVMKKFVPPEFLTQIEQKFSLNNAGVFASLKKMIEPEHAKSAIIIDTEHSVRAVVAHRNGVTLQ